MDKIDRSMSVPILMLLALSLFLGSCNYPGLNPAVQAPPAEPVGEAAQDQPTPPNPQDIPTAVPQPEPTAPQATGPPAAPFCVPTQAGVPFSAGAFADYPRAIQDYLNAGATAEALDAVLYDAGVASMPLPVATEDLTGNGLIDVVVSLINPDSPGILPGGGLWVFSCEAGAYGLRYEQRSQEGFGAPHIWYLEDLDADGRAELVVSEATCGAHTCFEALQVLDFEGGAFVNRLEGDSLDLPNPDIRIDDPDEDGIYNLLVVGGGVGSVGAGPPREVARVWALQGETGFWEPTGDLLGPSDYRLHSLHDAEAAAQDGDLPTALGLYQRVVVDETLRDWVDPETERANLGAYARYKIVVLYILSGQQEFARTTLAEMQAEYPAWLPQHSYVLLAETFLNGVAQGGVEAGCAAARDYAARDAGRVLDPLGPQAFGYSSPEISAQAMCP